MRPNYRHCRSHWGNPPADDGFSAITWLSNLKKLQILDLADNGLANATVLSNPRLRLRAQQQQTLALVRKLNAAIERTRSHAIREHRAGHGVLEHTDMH